MTVWLPVVGMLALAAALLLRAGLRGRRIGTEPFCRKCEYQLTGLQSNRCPECGSELGDRAVVHGVPRRRWGLVTLAVMLMVGGMSWQIISWRWSAPSYYRGLPFPLLRYLESGGSAAAGEEVIRRLQAGEVSRRQLSAMFEDLVAELQESQPAAARKYWVQYLNAMFTADLLTPDQQARVFPVFSQPKLIARPVIRGNDPVPLVLRLEPVRPGIDWFTVEQECRALSRGGDAPSERARRLHDTTSSCILPPNISKVIELRVPWTATTPPAGEHAIRYEGHIRFARTVGTFQANVIGSATVTVLDDSAPDPVRWVEDHALTEKLPSLLALGSGCSNTISNFLRVDPYSTREMSGPAWRNTTRLSVTLLEPVTPALAFTVGLEAKGALVRGVTQVAYLGLGSPCFAWRAGETGQRCVDVFWLGAIEAEEVYVILESSKDVARETVDIFDVWRGSVRLGPFRTSVSEEEEKTNEDGE